MFQGELPKEVDPTDIKRANQWQSFEFGITWS